MSEYDDNGLGETAVDDGGFDQDADWYVNYRNGEFDDVGDDGGGNGGDDPPPNDDNTAPPADDKQGEQEPPKPAQKPYTPPPSEPKQELKRPVLEEFDDYGAYEDALDDYRIAVAMERIKAEQAQAQEAERQAVLEREFAKAVDELAGEGVDIVALQAQAETLPPLPVSLDNFGLSVKDTLKLAKDLMDNPTLYHELAQMNPYQMAMRVGRFLDERAGEQSTPQTPPKPKQSKAPPPIKPLTANGVATKNPYASSDDDFLKSRGLA